MTSPSSRAWHAGIIAVGSELLTPFRADTNSLYLTAELNNVGIDVTVKHIVGDRHDDLLAVFRATLARVDLVVCTGGLGPTEDDITRTVIADALGLPLELDAEVLDRIMRRFATRGIEMPLINRRQAFVPRGATVLANANGTAPGLLIEHTGKLVVLLPGPPGELRPMFESVVCERLSPLTAGMRLVRQVLRIAGRPESYVEERAQPVYSRWTAAEPPIATSILAAPGQVELHLSVRAASDTAGQSVLARAVGELVAVLGPDVFSVDGRTLEQVVGDLLRQRGWRIAVAESCTGGLVLSRLTDIPGSSDYVDRGVVCYSNEAKIEWLGVPESLLLEHGAVSEPVGVAMASGARLRAGVEVGLGVTGIAGPTGGSDRKPVGTVVIAAVSPGGERVHTHQFLGGREAIKFQASQAALDMVRRMLEELSRASVHCG